MTQPDLLSGCEAGSRSDTVKQVKAIDLFLCSQTRGSGSLRVTYRQGFKVHVINPQRNAGTLSTGTKDWQQVLCSRPLKQLPWLFMSCQCVSLQTLNVERCGRNPPTPAEMTRSTSPWKPCSIRQPPGPGSSSVFHPSVGLGMEAWGQAGHGSHQAAEIFPEAGGELWASVQDYIHQEPVEPEDMLYQQLSRFLGCRLLLDGHKMCHLARPVDYR